MIHFNALDFNECRSEEVTLSVHYVEYSTFSWIIL